jgi:ABC-type lipoprotein export system ATPase subunit
MIELINISKTYKSKYASVKALQEVSLTLPDKGIVFIVGKSGCGKTTLLNVLGGLDRFDSGDFRCNGESAKGYCDADWDKYRNSFVGFVFQENNLLEEYNVYENVRLAINLQGIKNESEVVSNALRYVDLEGYQKRKISELSGGQKQRVAIARAIAKNSKVLLADEPTGSLDENTGKDIFSLLKTLSETQLVVVVTHDVASAKLYGDVLIEMSDGRIIETAKLNEINMDERVVFENPKKGRLTPRICLTLATKSFKRTPIRLLVLVLLSMFGFSLMTGALKFSFWQPYDLQNQVLEANGKAVVALTPITKELGGGMARDEERFFDATKLANFKNAYPNLRVFNVAEHIEPYGNNNMFGTLDQRQRTYYNDTFQGKISLSANDLELFGIELLAGEKPSSEWDQFDVAISEYFFEMYCLTNYSENGLDIIEISTYQNLIGQKIYGKYTIRAVLNTHFDKEDFAFVKEYALGQSDYFSVDWTSAFSYYVKVGFHNLLFMKPGYEFETDSLYVVIPYDVPAFAESNFVRTIFDSNDYYFNDYYSQILKHQSSQSVRFGGIMIAIALVAIAFAVVLFANFISVSIFDKMRQIGILRALGATENGVASIFILQNILIALIVFVLSSVTVHFAIMPLLLKMGTTTTFPFPWYVMKVVDYIILFGLVAVTAVAASLLPLIRLAKKTPREIIATSK